MEHLKKHLVFIRTSIELGGEINRLVTPEEIDAASTRLQNHVRPSALMAVKLGLL